MKNLQLTSNLLMKDGMVSSTLHTRIGKKVEKNSVFTTFLQYCVWLFSKKKERKKEKRHTRKKKYNYLYLQKTSLCTWKILQYLQNSYYTAETNIWDEQSCMIYTKLIVFLYNNNEKLENKIVNSILFTIAYKIMK